MLEAKKVSYLYELESCSMQEIAKQNFCESWQDKKGARALLGQS